MFGGLLAVIALWLIGDFAYSRYVAYQINRWEASQEFGEDGILRGAEEFSLGPAASSTAVIMVHGFCDTPQIYRKIAPPLADRGIRCRGILLPGFGRSIAAYADSNREQWLEKLDAEIRAARGAHDRVFVVAHSLGGALTINYLLQESHAELDGVVLLAPAIEVASDRVPVGTALFWHRFSCWTLPFSRVAYSPFSLDVNDPAEKDRPDRNRFSPRSVVEYTFQLIAENRGRASQLELPLLMLVAPEDKIIDTAAIEAFYEQWGSTDKRLVRLENSGHMIPVDKDWEQVQREILKFVE